MSVMAPKSASHSIPTSDMVDYFNKPHVHFIHTPDTLYTQLLKQPAKKQKVALSLF